MMGGGTATHKAKSVSGKRAPPCMTTEQETRQEQSAAQAREVLLISRFIPLRQKEPTQRRVWAAGYVRRKSEWLRKERF
jgi:hypothetical protein